MKFGFFSGTFLQKPPRIPNFAEIRSVTAGPIHGGGWADEKSWVRTDGHDEVNRRFSPARLKISCQQQDDLINLVTVCGESI